MEQPVRQACEMTLMTELELIIFKKLSSSFFKEMSQDFEAQERE